MLLRNRGFKTRLSETIFCSGLLMMSNDTRKVTPLMSCFGISHHYLFSSSSLSMCFGEGSGPVRGRR